MSFFQGLKKFSRYYLNGKHLWIEQNDCIEGISRIQRWIDSKDIDKEERIFESNLRLEFVIHHISSSGFNWLLKKEMFKVASE